MDSHEARGVQLAGHMAYPIPQQVRVFAGMYENVIGHFVSMPGGIGGR